MEHGGSFHSFFCDTLPEGKSPNDEWDSIGFDPATRSVANIQHLAKIRSVGSVGWN